MLKLSQGLRFDSNDLGAHQYRKVTSLRIPNLSANVLLTTIAERNTWLEAADVALDLYLDIYTSPTGHRLITRNQLAFIEEQDKLTNRAKTMFNQLRQRTKANLDSGTQQLITIPGFAKVNHIDRVSHINGVYLPQPTLPNLATKRMKSIETKRGPIPGVRLPSWRFSNMANLSDSDSEEWISEADRDARLA